MIILIVFCINIIRCSTIGLTPWTEELLINKVAHNDDVVKKISNIRDIIWDHNPNQNTGGFFIYYAISNTVPALISQRILAFTEQLLLHTCVVFSDIASQERIG